MKKLRWVICKSLNSTPKKHLVHSILCLRNAVPMETHIERSRNEVADVLEKLGKNVENLGLNTWQLRTLSAIKRCRTAALGGHIDACNDCGNISISYNSCRNRHCPKCQGKNRDDWIHNHKPIL